jgi:hypothetical protein
MVMNSPKRRILQLGQGQVGDLVLDVKPVVVTVLRQAPVTQQGPYKDRLLPIGEINSISNFPRRYPIHPNHCADRV